MKSFVPALVLGLLTAVTGCGGGSSGPTRLKGAGSTFIAPLMIQWIHEYGEHRFGSLEGADRQEEVWITYQAIGSGAGILRISDSKLDFLCTDSPLTDEQLAKAAKSGGEVVHIPLALGAVVPTYNLPGVKEPLHFSGPVLADIYLGKIKRWNDGALRQLNPDASLPDKEIVVVHRRDGSGTTAIWADYLSKVSSEWKARLDGGTDIKWPVGVAQIGNAGVAQHVKDTHGSIGYVELNYAHRLDLPVGLVRNRAKEFIKATLDSITMAGADLTEVPDDLRFSLTDPPGEGAYPICGATWAIVRVTQPAANRKALVDFLSWLTHDGQSLNQSLFYANLPKELVERAEKKIDRVKAGK